jgi:asparagine synthase (glutamine-hydrolysing)
MCGIAGRIDFSGEAEPETLDAMLEAMVHRGPHSRGRLIDEGVALGMQRLAIIDVLGGDQPIFNEDRSVAVVMNGEIYNFQTLRRTLSERGHRFATRSDTEVLVHLYEDHGEDLVTHLRGMFAFALWDRRRRALLLGRDRLGKKPLFLCRRGHTITFASELFALLQDDSISREPDERAIASYLTLQYVPHSRCAVRGVEKLAPAHTLWIDRAGIRSRRYWTLRRGETPTRSPDDLAEELRHRLWEATRERLVSDVPLGAFLSGGIDSSAVVAAMATQTSEPVKTFSIGFPDDPAYDELRFARMVAERYGTDHHEFDVRPDAIGIAERLARHYGEPYADSSAIPSFCLAEMTARHVTVALNGDGGDESFAGYRRYVMNDLSARFSSVPAGVRGLLPRLLSPLGEGSDLSGTRARVSRFARTLPFAPDERYARWMSACDPEERARMFAPEFLNALDGWEPAESIQSAWRASEGTVLERMLQVDIATYLPDDLLVKMDIATMANSLEARSPFLDHRLVEFAASLPPRLKLRGREGKVLLKRALADHLPGEILSRRKMGFGVPLARWFREDLRDLPREMLLDPGARVARYVRGDSVARMLREHAAQTADHSTKLWILLQLEMWHRHVLESAPVATGMSVHRVTEPEFVP